MHDFLVESIIERLRSCDEVLLDLILRLLLESGY